MSHPCPIPGCETPAKDGQLMCLAHWRRVPKALNQAVFATYRNMSQRGQDSASRREAVFAYREARDAAISAVTAKDRGWEYDL